MAFFKEKLRELSVFRIIIIGFAILILLGSLLLTLPCASADGKACRWLDALFTSASAVCVTGLVVRDTALSWSMFGKMVILFLIQTGGLGVVTAASAIAVYAGQKLGLKQRFLLQSAVSAPQMGGIVRLMSLIMKTTFLVEAAGALLLFPSFCRDFGALKGAWYAVFHSVSAFCNAGFDLMGMRAPYSSMTGYAGDIGVNTVLMLLITIGGIGCFDWQNVLAKKCRFSALPLQSKLIFTTSAILVIMPAIYFYCLECGAHHGKERVLTAVFQSVTLRTAGFNTMDEAKLSDTGKILSSVLMIIGGSPGSTAGGMKTTAFAVLLLSAAAALRREKNVCIFGRRLDGDTIKNSAALAVLYFMLFMIGASFMSTLETIPITDCMFECASALGTVGVTVGITPSLGTASKAMLIGFMFFGRAGGLTLAYAAIAPKPEYGLLPQEQVTVG